MVEIYKRDNYGSSKKRGDMLARIIELSLKKFAFNRK
jgi:hypothetical protein